MTAKASDSGIPYAVESDRTAGGDAVPPPLPPSVTYTPTLLDYAEVIDWLCDRMDQDIIDGMPERLRRAFVDADRRWSLARVMRAMEKAAREDAEDEWAGDL